MPPSTAPSSSNPGAGLNGTSQTILNKENNKKDSSVSSNTSLANAKVALKPREFGRDVTNSSSAAAQSNNSKFPQYTLNEVCYGANPGAVGSGVPSNTHNNNMTAGGVSKGGRPDGVGLHKVTNFKK